MTNHKSADGPLPTSDEIAALPPDGGPEFNRLIHEKSPYLLQHARNPVNWYPWSPEAFERAENEDKPVFLSIGYSTCHWCHVMERESFENEEIGEILNRYYVSIKVDREERPDVDEIYMNATQLIGGRGGWPNSLWLLPDGRPWYAGTYFPPEDSPGRPGFRTILMRLAEFWRTRREEVETQADKLSEAMKQITSGRSIETTGQPSRELVQRALRELNRSFDKDLGGFGTAPKFPPHGSFNLIFYEYGRSQDASLLEMATRTLDAMSRGGIRDHVGGGFHRYSTDARWLLPHFEKMLYDNAQLGRAYVNAYLITKDENYRSVAVDTYEWVLREMTHQDGGFFSALDADSEGEEGKFYLWSRDEIIAVLGKGNGELFCRAYTIKGEGNFRDEATGEMTGTNIPHLERSLAEIAAAEGLAVKDLHSRLTKDCHKLLKQRENRIWPHLDDKVLTAWNGLMIGSLAYGGRHLNEPRYIAAAEKAADFILATMRENGRLLRTYRDGEAKLNAYLDDYAFLAEGLLELYNDSGDERRLDEARELMEMLLLHYWDEADGGFFFTPDDHEQLLIRSKDPYDKATPSGNGVAARILVRLDLLTGERDYLEKAKASCDAFLGFMERVPGGTESLILALAMYLDVMADVNLAKAGGEQLSSDIVADAYVREGPVTAEAFVSRLKVAPGENFEVAIRLTIDDGWHINSNRPLQEYLKPLLISLEENPNITIDEVAYPASSMVTFPFNPEPLAVYKGEVGIKINLAVAGDAGEGHVALNFKIPVQPCNDNSCQASKTLKLSIPMLIDMRADAEESRHESIFRSFGAV